MNRIVDLDQLERYRVRPGHGRLKLDAIDPADRRGLPLSKAEARAARRADCAEIACLQDILYAQAKQAVVVVLQGMDASGKDGTIQSVFAKVPPLGVVTTNFNRPTAHELAHDFLWRVHKAVPPLRMIGVFNRSHYEDVLTERVHRLVPLDRLEARYGQINAFEKHLAENDITILKCFLHISKREQKRRLQARLADPTKRWKFSGDDLTERGYWDDYMAAYEIALMRCSTARAPWFIVPSDRKWYRNAVVARLVCRTLEGLDLRYPRDIPGLKRVRIK